MGAYVSVESLLILPHLSIVVLFPPVVMVDTSVGSVCNTLKAVT